jgi:hypothetical protein
MMAALLAASIGADPAGRVVLLHQVAFRLREAVLVEVVVMKGK